MRLLLDPALVSRLFCVESDAVHVSGIVMRHPCPCAHDEIRAMPPKSLDRHLYASEYAGVLHGRSDRCSSALFGISLE